MNVFSFSGGRTSAYMTKEYYKQGDLVVFANTGKEAEGTLEYVRDFEANFNIPIVWLEYFPATKFKIVDFDTASRNGEPFQALIQKKKYLPNQVTRFCSMELKALTIKRYLRSCKINPRDVDMYLGIRADEPNRYYRLKGNDRNHWENVMPLFKAGITKQDVLNYWENQSFDLNINKYAGNCDLCFLKGTTKKVQLLRQKPEVAAWWAEMEELIGATFNKKYSIKQLVNMSEKQLTIFDNDIDCSCTID